jgi:S-adenosylmethionine decarboxylase
MEVWFRADKGPENGLRCFTRKQLDLICKKARCAIVHQMSNQHLDAYILSESSLFIYKHRFIMKTCGTTTLLRCLGTLLHFADKLQMEVTWVGYSRKNLTFPENQQFPHSSFHEEITYMQTHEKLQNRLLGSGHILGPITGDHWFVYVADLYPDTRLISFTNSSDSPIKAANTSTISLSGRKLSNSNLLSLLTGESSNGSPINLNAHINDKGQERTMNMMMFDMCEEISHIFYQCNTASAKEMTLKSGINHLCPGATIDETAFTPCGYSMNAILHDAYSTIHVTPEQACSYCSFETNAMLSNYTPLMRNILSVFKPRRFVVTMFGDDSAISALKTLPNEAAFMQLPNCGIYQRSSSSTTKVDAELTCLMAVYSLIPGSLNSGVVAKTISALNMMSSGQEYLDNNIDGENESSDAGSSSSASATSNVAVNDNGNTNNVFVPIIAKERSFTWC